MLINPAYLLSALLIIGVSLCSAQYSQPQQTPQVPSCPGDKAPAQNSVGQQLSCLPSVQECPAGHACTFNGYNFMCCQSDGAGEDSYETSATKEPAAAVYAYPKVASPTHVNTPALTPTSYGAPIAQLPNTAQCFRGLQPTLDARTGQVINCLPTTADCPQGSVCWFTGFDYNCCPSPEEESYATKQAVSYQAPAPAANSYAAPVPVKESYSAPAPVSSPSYRAPAPASSSYGVSGPVKPTATYAAPAPAPKVVNYNIPAPAPSYPALSARAESGSFIRFNFSPQQMTRFASAKDLAPVESSYGRPAEEKEEPKIESYDAQPATAPATNNYIKSPQPVANLLRPSSLIYSQQQRKPSVLTYSAPRDGQPETVGSLPSIGYLAPQTPTNTGAEKPVNELTGYQRVPPGNYAPAVFIYDAPPGHSTSAPRQAQPSLVFDKPPASSYPAASLGQVVYRAATESPFDIAHPLATTVSSNYAPAPQPQQPIQSYQVPTRQPSNNYQQPSNNYQQHSEPTRNYQSPQAPLPSNQVAVPAYTVVQRANQNPDQPPPSNKPQEIHNVQGHRVIRYPGYGYVNYLDLVPALPVATTLPPSSISETRPRFDPRTSYTSDYSRWMTRYGTRWY